MKKCKRIHFVFISLYKDTISFLSNYMRKRKTFTMGFISLRNPLKCKWEIKFIFRIGFLHDLSVNAIFFHKKLSPVIFCASLLSFFLSFSFPLSFFLLFFLLLFKYLTIVFSDAQHLSLSLSYFQPSL